jgi:DNA-binding response OmpR family regulator
MKVLIAEDNRASRVLLEKLLKLQGHEVLSSDNGLEAIDLFSLHNFDMIFLDWMMPKMTGIEVARKIREAEKSKEAKAYIIMITSKSGQDNMLTALESGVDDFITKPIDSSTLISRIKEAERNRKDLPTNAISILMEEHVALSRMLRVFEAIAAKLGTVRLSNSLLEWVSSTAIMLDTEVHHKKEDYFMMIFLERALKIHGEAPNSRVFSRASLKTIEDEHEKILILLADIQIKVKRHRENVPGADMTLKVTLNEYIPLMKKHMDREDRLLFPLSYKYLIEEDMARLLIEFENVEMKVGIEKLDKRLEQIIKAEKILKIQ